MTYQNINDGKIYVQPSKCHIKNKKISQIKKPN